MTKKVDEALATLARVVPTRFSGDVATVKAEIERLKDWLKLIDMISELPDEPCDYIPVTALYEINLRAKEALKDAGNL